MDKISQHTTIESLINKNNFSIKLSDNEIKQVEKSFKYLNEKLNNTKHLYYGINTGFGSLCNVAIDNQQLAQLQENLIKSHACGMDEKLPVEIIQWILFAKIKNIIQGNSGVHINTLQRLVDFFNHQIYPVIYKLGSLGASGDLAPLAHLSLPLIGLGEVYYQNEIISTSDLYQKLGWEKLTLHPKEGLALLNGTQYMTGIGVYLLINVIPLFTATNIISAISLEAFNCRYEPFHPLINKVRKHNGQKVVAEQINTILSKSKSFYSKENKAVQDPYSFRCIPQVHGASYDLIQFVKEIFETEINSVTDNPLIFPEEDAILSGGNFHGQILSNAFDTLSLALNQLGGISERRTYQLISGSRNLPAFLVKNSGLNSGFMIPQYTAASIVNRNKILCTPASADSIVSSNGQEDYVSMGANAANKCLEIFENLKSILAIELMTATQAFELRKNIQSSDFIHYVISEYRKEVPFIENDSEMYIHLNTTKKFIEKNLLNWYFQIHQIK
ncbi:MAG TPA: aromatic amino acid ammonia-lyase [Bacteroidia bacterium]|nr:aromatic amino acid ammonia-lyase [Bacteroidia bacterium]